MEIFEQIKNTVEKNRALILDTLSYINANPETGYKEKKTSAHMEQIFENLCYDIVKAGDIPGFYTVVDTEREGPEILVLGELDALICPKHPNADPETGAVHVCGHSAQCAALVGVAAVLKEKKILEKLCGKIRLCAVPAEELLEIEYRNSLREKGVIKYFGGKSEFLRRGYFDGCDIAFMVHTTPGDRFSVNLGGVGCIAKIITYHGKSAHAGGSPWNGINSLYAASAGLNAINAIRETFKESDIIRVHPIITSGGSAVNAIPETTVIESYVRGNNVDAIADANKKVNRALCGAALSLGANVDIYDIPGYQPYRNDKGLIEIAKDALTSVLPCETLFETGAYSSGSTDMGDLSAVMPMIHPYAPGASGTSHGDNYYIANPNKACVESAMWQVSMLCLLLSNGGERAYKIKNEYTPRFKTKEEFLSCLDSVFRSGNRITYNGDNAVVEL